MKIFVSKKELLKLLHQIPYGKKEKIYGNSLADAIYNFSLSDKLGLGGVIKCT